MRYKKKLSECLTNVNINHLQEFQKLYHMTFYIKEFLLLYISFVTHLMELLSDQYFQLIIMLLIPVSIVRHELG